MEFPRIAWHVRIIDKTDLTELGKRVEQAMQISLTSAHPKNLDYAEVLEANLLGLSIYLVEDTKEFADGARRYMFTGGLQDRIFEQYFISDEEGCILVSEHIAGVLRLLDSPNWYVPDLKELLE